MAEFGQRRSKLPSDAVIHPRSAANDPIRAEDAEEQTATEYLMSGFRQLQEALGEVARQTENRGNLVDEYNIGSITAAVSESTVSVMPTYEMMPEKIESVIIAGPPATAVTLTLGDRQLPLVIPATGILVIAPIAAVLGRNDARQLTSATPGMYFLELMGVADRRFAA